MKRHKLHIPGPAGRIETVVEEPDGEIRGLALVAHPHPLHGGSLDNKVTFTLARAALACGLVAVRSNFRGVGGSEGGFDQGAGETEDLLCLAAWAEGAFGALPWTLLGFSFGAYVQHRVAASLSAQRLIMVGPAVSRFGFDAPPVPAVILHGAEDEVVPLDAVRAYAERWAVPLHVVAGTGHFFHGQLKPLQALVEGLCCPERNLA
ncbi:MAG: alpha/beta hydrolase [Betaproteobacteria bacterium]|nr:alpha/beta hydrolase [Betaproteobacteria bacterium]